MEQQFSIPDTFREDVRRAAEILKAAGCTAVYVFGSLVKGSAGESSDLDLAVRGCPKAKFFHLWGKLHMALDHSVDLVDLDSEDPFAHYLQTHVELVQVG